MAAPTSLIQAWGAPKLTRRAAWPWHGPGFNSGFNTAYALAPPLALAPAPNPPGAESLNARARRLPLAFVSGARLLCLSHAPHHKCPGRDSHGGGRGLPPVPGRAKRECFRRGLVPIAHLRLAPADDPRAHHLIPGELPRAHFCFRGALRAARVLHPARLRALRRRRARRCRAGRGGGGRLGAGLPPRGRACARAAVCGRPHRGCCRDRVARGLQPVCACGRLPPPTLRAPSSPHPLPPPAPPSHPHPRRAATAWLR